MCFSLFKVTLKIDDTAPLIRYSNLLVRLLRYEKQLEQEEQAYQQQRRRLYADVQEEKERVALQAQKQRQELDEAREALEVSMGIQIDQASHFTLCHAINQSEF